MPADKNIMCQGDTTTSKMAADEGILYGTNLETRHSRSAEGDTQTHFLTSTMSLNHKWHSGILTARRRNHAHNLNMNMVKTESEEYGYGLYRDIDQRYLVTPSGHN